MPNAEDDSASSGVHEQAHTEDWEEGHQVGYQKGRADAESLIKNLPEVNAIPGPQGWLLLPHTDKRNSGIGAGLLQGCAIPAGIMAVATFLSAGFISMGLWLCGIVLWFFALLVAGVLPFIASAKTLIETLKSWRPLKHEGGYVLRKVGGRWYVKAAKEGEEAWRPLDDFVVVNPQHLAKGTMEVHQEEAEEEEDGTAEQKAQWQEERPPPHTDADVPPEALPDAIRRRAQLRIFPEE